MKVLMVCDFYDASLEYQENLLTKYYSKLGHSVVIVSSVFSNVFKYINNDFSECLDVGVNELDGVKLYRCRYSLNFLNKIRFFAGFEKILMAEKPDLVFVHDIMPDLVNVVPYLKSNCRAKLIMDYHADYSNSAKNWISLKILHGVIRKFFLTRSMPYISKIFPVVPASTIFLKEVYGVLDEYMELLPLAADIDEVRAIEKSLNTAELKVKLNIKDDHVVIFTGGKLTPAKRTELIIKVVSQAKYKKVDLLVVGDSSAEELSYLKSLKDMASKATNVHFLGWASSKAIYEYLMISDIAVFPASQSVLWQKAISVGLPLIVGDVGNQDPSYLSPNQNIILLQREEINESCLDKVLYELLMDVARREEMAVGAKKTTEVMLDWNNLILKTLRFNLP